jgi:hypothetical protein
MPTAATCSVARARDVCGARAQHRVVGRARVEVARHDGERARHGRAGVSAGATRPATAFVIARKFDR